MSSLQALVTLYVRRAIYSMTGVVCLGIRTIKPTLQFLRDLLRDNQWDAFLLIISGILLLFIGYSTRQDVNQQVYVNLLKQTGYVAILYTAHITATCGITNIFIGVFRLALPSPSTWVALKRYIYVLILLILISIVFWVAVSTSRSWIFPQVSDLLEAQLSQLGQANVGLLGQEAYLMESWDRLQMTMFCCGADGYQDYLSLPVFSANQEHPIPQSCCVLQAHEPPQPVNSRQCLADAKARVADSVFLNVRGCSAPFLAWLNEYSSTFTAIACSALLCEVFALGYVYWKYRNLWYGRAKINQDRTHDFHGFNSS